MPEERKSTCKGHSQSYVPVLVVPGCLARLSGSNGLSSCPRGVIGHVNETDASNNDNLRTTATGYPYTVDELVKNTRRVAKAKGKAVRTPTPSPEVEGEGEEEREEEEEGDKEEEEDEKDHQRGNIYGP